MAKIELYVAIEISDDAAAMLDTAFMGGATGAAITIVRNALSGQNGFRKVTVDTAEVAEDSGSDVDETQDAPDTQTPDSVRTAARARLRDAANYSAPKGGPSGKTGRPATLHHLKASDGEPVRASGPRSREALESQGIAVWDESKGERGPSVRKNSGERNAPAKPGKPVLRTRQ